MNWKTYTMHYVRKLVFSSFNAGVAAIAGLIGTHQAVTFHNGWPIFEAAFLLHLIAFLYANPLPDCDIGPVAKQVAAATAMLALCLGLSGCAFDPAKTPQVNFDEWKHVTNIGPVTERGTVENQKVSVQPDGSLLIHQDTVDQSETYLGWGREDNLKGVNLVIPASKVKQPVPPVAATPTPAK